MFPLKIKYIANFVDSTKTEQKLLAIQTATAALLAATRELPRR